MPQSSKMMWVWAAIALVVIAGGAWWWSSTSGPTIVPLVVNENGGTSAPRVVQGSISGVSANGNSDTALTADLSSIDAQIASFSNDVASVDLGLNDQPIPQN